MQHTLTNMLRVWLALTNGVDQALYGFCWILGDSGNCPSCVLELVSLLHLANDCVTLGFYLSMSNILSIMVVVLVLAGLVTGEQHPICRVLYYQFCVVYLAVKLGAVIPLMAAFGLVVLILSSPIRTSVRVSS